MLSRPSHQLRHQRGFTLMEILVAVAIFATVMIVALLLYDRSNQVFKQSNEAAEMQQNTRVAYEKMVADLRMAGFDYKRAGTPAALAPAPWVAARGYSAGSLVTPTTPNGHVYKCTSPGTSGASEPGWTTAPNSVVPDNTVTWQEAGAPVFEQPDEQLEYVHHAAVTLRANFDYNDGNDNGREAALESGNFPVVTTGNDEIVTYALVSKKPGAANADSITFYADVNNGGTPSRTSYPGGNKERLITISGVDLSNANPPYTLMRYTLKADGTPDAVALADNIRSMNLQYWEDAAATRALTDLSNNPITDVGGLGQYDPGSPNAKIDDRIIRGKIRAVTVTIVGMNPQPDYAYTHPTDTVAPNYRQYALHSTVVGRNLGLEGVPQNSNNPPGPPTVESACSGYCGVAFIYWKPDPATVDASYTVLYDKTASGSFTGVLPAGTQTSYAVDLTDKLPDATTWYFKVAATNPYGTTVSKNYIAVDVRNATKPDPPTNVTATATAGKPNELTVKWKMPSSATGTLSCTAGSPPVSTVAAEMKGYRVHRSKTAGFNIGDPGVVVVMNENTGGAIADGLGGWTFVDNTVAACETYYYKVQAVEWCAAAAAYNTTGTVDTGFSALSAQASAYAPSVADPRQPQNLKMHPDTLCDEIAGKCYPVILTWDKVTQDTAGNTINVEDYLIEREQKTNGVVTQARTTVGTISDGTTTFSEPASLPYDNSAGKMSYVYYITAYEGLGVGGCERKSAVATISVPDACQTGATIVPNMLGPGSGTQADPWQNVDSIQVVPYATQPVLSVAVSVDGGPFNPLALPYVYDHTDPGDGRLIPVTFQIKTANCSETTTVYIQNDPPSCLLTGSVVSSTVNPLTALRVNIRSSSAEDITIQGIDVTWAGQSGFQWNSITLPSGAVINASGTPANARTASFTPGAADKTIAAGGSYFIRLNFSGSGLPLGSTVTNVRFRYTVPATGNVVHDCPIDPMPRCSVIAEVQSVNQSTISVKISNGSNEALDLSTLSIAWTDQFKLVWDRIILPSTASLPVNSAGSGGTETFTIPASDKTILAGGSYTIQMKYTSTFNNPPNADPANVGAVTLVYKTPTSSGNTLTCRAK